jgi:hypothetical protein
MNIDNTLSVNKAATLCGVARGTVGYWIRTGKLLSRRKGKNYRIILRDLLIFLNSTGRKCPAQLTSEYLRSPVFSRFQPCWEYWRGELAGHECKDCTVYLNRMEVCFAARGSKKLNCESLCPDCNYYLETYLPRIHFVHQIDLPALVLKDLTIWGANSRWASLCDVPGKELTGMGIEEILYADSIKTVLSNTKKENLGDIEFPDTYHIFLRTQDSEKLKVRIWVNPLLEPRGTRLILAKPV